jgi:hypothetical protein
MTMTRTMKRRVVLGLSLAAAAVVSTGLVVGVRADRRDVVLRAQLRGLNEVPPTASRASGSLRATLDEDGQTFTFTFTFQDLSGPPTAAHVHFGPSKVNGGVSFFFCGGGGKPACPAATSGTITGTVVAADIVGPTAQGITAGDFADVVRAIVTGNAYANMHSALFPGGEIRGPVVMGGFGRSSDDDDD